MPKCYVDTSALAKWYLNEPLSEVYTPFLDKADQLFVSDLVRVEFLSLVGRCCRRGLLNKQQRKEVWRRFNDDVDAGDLCVLTVYSEDYRYAEELLVKYHESALGAADAIHLAVALTGQYVTHLVTDDKKFAATVKKTNLKLVCYS